MSTDLKRKLVARIGKKGGFRASINAHCCQCIYDELVPGTWRKQVENCTVSDCELYHLRPTPYSKGGHGNGDVKK